MALQQEAGASASVTELTGVGRTTWWQFVAASQHTGTPCFKTQGGVWQEAETAPG